MKAFPRKTIVIIVSVLAVVILLIVGFVKTNTGVSLQCAKIDQNSAELYIHNNTWSAYTCGDSFDDVEYLADGKWEHLPQKATRVSYPMIYYVDAHDKKRIDINFKQIYGTLATGKYRISVTVAKADEGPATVLYYEFEIE